MSVVYGLMGHHSRAHNVHRILHDLERPCISAIDQRDEGPWSTAARVWHALVAKSLPMLGIDVFREHNNVQRSRTWCCLLQDDIELAPDFAAALELLISHDNAADGKLLRGRPLVLCNMGRVAASEGSHWIERVDGVNGPALCMRVRDVESLLVWSAINVRPEQRSSDLRVGIWLEMQKRSTLRPEPSWVQHRADLPSVFGTRAHPSQMRQASTFTRTSLLAQNVLAGLNRELPKIGRPDAVTMRCRGMLWRVGAEQPDDPRFADSLSS